MINNIKKVKHMFICANTFGPYLVQYHLTLTLDFWNIQRNSAICQNND